VVLWLARHILVETKDYEIGICCFDEKHTEFRSKSNDGLARNQNNVSRVE